MNSSVPLFKVTVALSSQSLSDSWLWENWLKKVVFQYFGTSSFFSPVIIILRPADGIFHANLNRKPQLLTHRKLGASRHISACIVWSHSRVCVRNLMLLYVVSLLPRTITRQTLLTRGWEGVGVVTRSAKSKKLLASFSRTFFNWKGWNMVR